MTATDTAGRLSTAVMTVTQVRLPSPLRVMSLTSSRPAPGVAGVPTTFSATASGGLAPYQYKWWLFDGMSWSVLRDWSEDETLPWAPEAANAGYRIAVWVRSAGTYANAPDNDASNASIPFPIVNDRRRRCAIVISAEPAGSSRITHSHGRA
jgi:hypothetical protein